MIDSHHTHVCLSQIKPQRWICSYPSSFSKPSKLFAFILADPQGVCACVLCVNSHQTELGVIRLRRAYFAWILANEISSHWHQGPGEWNSARSTKYKPSLIVTHTQTQNRSQDGSSGNTWWREKSHSEWLHLKIILLGNKYCTFYIALFSLNLKILTKLFISTHVIITVQNSLKNIHTYKCTLYR